MLLTELAEHLIGETRRVRIPQPPAASRKNEKEQRTAYEITDYLSSCLYHVWIHVWILVLWKMYHLNLYAVLLKKLTP
jgi:hypothetical protein